MRPLRAMGLPDVQREQLLRAHAERLGNPRDRFIAHGPDIALAALEQLNKRLGDARLFGEIGLREPGNFARQFEQHS
jgi:hypothetical protein